MDKKWHDLVYDDANHGSCGLCETSEDMAVSKESEHVLCPVCGFCLKYHCGCEVL